MTEVYLKKNNDGRFEAYNALTDKFVSTLTSGNPFMLIDEDYLYLFNLASIKQTFLY